MTTGGQVPYLTEPTGREHPLTGESITIGRALENDIVVTSKRVSRAHARVRREGRRVFLEDLGSTNGAFLNDERLLSPALLRDGDQITVGDVTLVFHDPDTTVRDAPFPELEVGQAATVTVDALPGREFAGQVSEIALQAGDYRGDVVYAVTVELDDVGDAPLRWGMTALVEIRTE